MGTRRRGTFVDVNFAVVAGEARLTGALVGVLSVRAASPSIETGSVSGVANIHTELASVAGEAFWARAFEVGAEVWKEITQVFQ